MPKFDVSIESLSKPRNEQGYTGFNPREEVLPAGWNEFKSRPLPCDILVQHDFGIKVRDGATLYADVYRPTCDEKVPALICWSPFGKKFNGLASLDLMTPWRLGIPDGTLSGLEKFEAPDPAEWIPKGYAIINIDSRGAFDSEGVMAIMGTQEAEDGYDVIEILAKEPWCNGSVGLVGNSHLAIIQWFIAALNPPSLKCIAPWEGCGDIYREQFARGGIYGGHLFDKLIIKYMLRGHNGIESFRKMYEEHPLANEWWNDKRPDMTKINIPTYITGTWSNTMHGMGAIRGWLEVATENKWLRFHATQEWYDLWGSEQAKAELSLFFDRYLKGKQNGWEDTPKVRTSILRFGEKPSISNIVENEFPPKRTEYKTAYLGPNSSLSFDKPSTTSAQSVQYNSEDSADFVGFRHTFEKKTWVLGMSKAILYMSCPDTDDLDIYLVLRKISATGEPLLCLNLPWDNLPIKKIADIPEDKRTEVLLYTGPTGILRASIREIDHSKSMHPNWPFHPHAKEEKVPAGDIVKLEIGIWATGIEFEAGESLQLQVCGSNQGISHFGGNEGSLNKGKHIVHFGGECNSHVILPFLEPK